MAEIMFLSIIVGVFVGVVVFLPLAAFIDECTDIYESFKVTSIIAVIIAFLVCFGFSRVLMANKELEYRKFTEQFILFEITYNNANSVKKLEMNTEKEEINLKLTEVKASVNTQNYSFISEDLKDSIFNLEYIS